MAVERTLIIIKPGAVARGLVGEVLSRLEKKGLKIVGLKMLKMSREKAEELYSVHKGKHFYEELINYITSAPVVAGVVEGQAREIIHHDYDRYLSYGTVILLFVLLNNCMGLLPGIDTPTSSPVIPLGLAILTFFYYNIYGIWKQGPINYFKHFLGPVWWLAWFMFPLEIVSHLARMVSLTVRLYANMFASDLLTLVFFSMVPVGLPVIFLGLHFFVALIQCYVFMLLTFIYMSQAVSHEAEL